MTDIKAIVGGLLTRVACAPGAPVTKGQSLFFVESMKMEIPVAAPREGSVAQILVHEGETIAEGQVLAVLGDAS